MTPDPSTLSDLGNELGLDLRVPWFDVTSRRFVGGAKGDGVTDDTAAIQAAFTAAVAVQGTVLFPPPVAGQFYIISDTITFGTVSGSANTVHVRTEGAPFTHIQWRGGSSKSIFHCYQLKRSHWQGLRVRTQPAVAQSSLIGFDFDGTSTGLNTMENVEFLDAGTGTGNTGWRFGSDASTNDISFWDFVNCAVTGNADTTSVGWDIRGANAKEMIWLGGATSSVNTGFTDRLGSSSGTDWYWYGHGGTTTLNPFVFTGSSKHTYGGRWESGKRFLDISNGSTECAFTVDGVTLAGFTPSDNIVFNVASRPVNARITGLKANGTDYTAAFLTIANQANGPANLSITGQVRSASATAPCTITDNAAGGFDLDWHVEQLNSANQVVAAFPPPDAPTTLTYSAAISTNAIRKGPFRITATNGTAFTINNPTNLINGRSYTYDILNSSGGAMGVVTWGSAGLFKLDATGFVNPANTKRKTITFYYDGTNLVQVGPTSADI